MFNKKKSGDKIFGAKKGTLVVELQDTTFEVAPSLNVEDINFPTYRKYKNNKRFYKIINKKEFEEIQVIGSKILINHLLATQLPEFNFVKVAADQDALSIAKDAAKQKDNMNKQDTAQKEIKAKLEAAGAKVELK